MSDSNTANGRFARGAWLRALERTARIERDPRTTLPMLIERLAADLGDAPALVSRLGSLTYRELAARCNRYARFGLEQGLGEGDTVGLMMGNCAEYLCVWLGLTRLGAAVALVNPQLAGEPLRHSLESVRLKLLIVDPPRLGAVADVVPALASRPVLWVSNPCGDGDAAAGEGHPEIGAAALGPVLERCPGDALDAGESRPVTLDATALYIYTSGTTGLPKAARVSHYRILQWSQWFAGLLDTTREDRMYDCLPLYHSVGGVVATGSTLLGGGAVVIRERFSASDFWRDVHAERCTLFQYIGELCRYLVNAPPAPHETGHSLRIACGNGLSGDVWVRFRDRFKIPRILEYYASTEGNFSLYNCEGEPGAIGRIPPFLASRLPVALVRFDVERGVPVRSAAGFCERCGVEEVGEALGLIPADGVGRIGRFEGYADPQATERKVLENVFEAGDRWYRTGDLMRRDARGFYYFVDRIGETFRWKGENVSTAEVAAALAACRGVDGAVAYGVTIPGADGRAGMAALVVNADFAIAQLGEEIRARLPVYARPVLLRIIGGIDTTGTFKPRTQELARAGFDPAVIADPLFILDAPSGSYVSLDADRHRALASGALKL